MPHPTSRSPTAWKFLELGLLVFPLIPILGALGLFLALVITWRQQYHKIIRRRLNWVLAILGIWMAIAPSFAFDRVAAFLGIFNFLPFFVLFAALSTLIQMQVWLGHPHSFLLMLTAEAGILFSMLFCGWVSWILIQGSRLLSQQHSNQDRLLLFSYLVAFFACILFNTVDVTIFDLRLNTLGWLLLSAISGVVYSQRSLLRRSL